MHRTVDIEELGALVVGPAMDLPPLGPDDLDELLELAAETDPRVPLETIKGLLARLRMRHAGDDATCAVLDALEHYYLPTLIDNAKG
jgi:hypothetical protein